MEWTTTALKRHRTTLPFSHDMSHITNHFHLCLVIFCLCTSIYVPVLSVGFSSFYCAYQTLYVFPYFFSLCFASMKDGKIYLNLICCLTKCITWPCKIWSPYTGDLFFRVKECNSSQTGKARRQREALVKSPVFNLPLPSKSVKEVFAPQTPCWGLHFSTWRSYWSHSIFLLCLNCS